MSVPFVAAGVEQWNELFCLGIVPRNVCALMVVARETGKTKIMGTCNSSVLECDNVIHLEGKLMIFLGQLAVFAKASCPVPNQFFKRAVHAGSGVLFLPVRP